MNSQIQRPPSSAVYTVHGRADVAVYLVSSYSLIRHRKSTHIPVVLYFLPSLTVTITVLFEKVTETYDNVILISEV
jgi:hypothetical protein